MNEDSFCYLVAESGSSVAMSTVSSEEAQLDGSDYTVVTLVLPSDYDQYYNGDAFRLKFPSLTNSQSLEPTGKGFIVQLQF